MLRIGIRFGDNDYHSTMRGFLKLIADAMLYNNSFEENLTKEIVYQIYQETIFSMYLLYQGRYAGEDRNYIQKYLKGLSIDEILIDDEVDAYLAAGGSGNCEFFYVDLEATLQLEMTGQRLEPVILVG